MHKGNKMAEVNIITPQHKLNVLWPNMLISNMPVAFKCRNMNAYWVSLWHSPVHQTGHRVCQYKPKQLHAWFKYFLLITAWLPPSVPGLKVHVATLSKLFSQYRPELDGEDGTLGTNALTPQQQEMNCKSKRLKVHSRHSIFTQITCGLKGRQWIPFSAIASN